MEEEDGSRKRERRQWTKPRLVLWKDASINYISGKSEYERTHRLTKRIGMGWAKCVKVVISYKLPVIK